MASISLTVWNLSDVGRLKNKGKYILGKLHSTSSSGEMSWIYTYEYKYKNKLFYRSFTGPLSKEIFDDSLMFFRVLPDDPEICRQMQDIRVPRCISLETVPKEGWDTLPGCR